jgi:ribonuclease VapC
MSSIGAIAAEIPVGTHDAALDTARTFGRFIGHPVRLNFGDCFSYASAKPLDASLLFVGNDFPQKDTAAA